MDVFATVWYVFQRLSRTEASADTWGLATYAEILDSRCRVLALWMNAPRREARIAGMAPADALNVSRQDLRKADIDTFHPQGGMG